MFYQFQLWRGAARPGSARRGAVRRGRDVLCIAVPARRGGHGLARPGMAGRGRIFVNLCCGLAWRHLAGPGTARLAWRPGAHGTAGMLYQFSVAPGGARYGEAWLGTARPGTACEAGMFNDFSCGKAGGARPGAARRGPAGRRGAAGQAGEAGFIKQTKGVRHGDYN
jgi:hypothetical protein